MHPVSTASVSSYHVYEVTTSRLEAIGLKPRARFIVDSTRTPREGDLVEVQTLDHRDIAIYHEHELFDFVTFVDGSTEGIFTLIGVVETSSAGQS